MNDSRDELFKAIALPGTPESSNMWELSTECFGSCETIDLFYEHDGLVRVVKFMGKEYKIKITQVKK